MKMKDILNEYMNIVEDSIILNKESFIEAEKYIKNSTAYYHGEPVPFLYIPKIFTEEVYAYLNKEAESIYAILSKVIKEYLNNAEYRKLFGFSDFMEKLILSESGYDCVIPITRIDLFLNEETLDYKFCEFNTDGTSAMNEDRELVNAISQTYAFKVMSDKYNFTSFELFDSWVEEFEKIYSEYKNKKDNPFIAIVDFMESATPNEFEVFKNRFIAKGYDTEIIDVRDLIYKESGLYTSAGERIDVIYRRAVSSEIENKKELAKPLIDAVLNEEVCLIGHFKTQIVHNKRIFKILNSKDTFKFLDEDEIEFIKKHIPYTVDLKDNEFDRKEVIHNKDKWIIKPGDLYASMGVYAGVDKTKEEWEYLINENLNNDYLLQEYYTPYKTHNIDFNISDEFCEYNNILGMYVYGGHLAGLYSRAGRKGIIAGVHGGRTMPVFLIKN